MNRLNDIMVATSALATGIDVPDIALTFHVDAMLNRFEFVQQSTQACFEVSGSENDRLPAARWFILLLILRTQLNQLRSQMPTLFFRGDLEENWRRIGSEPLKSNHSRTSVGSSASSIFVSSCTLLL